MMTTQESVYKTQLQLHTQQISNTYSGIAKEASRLVNMENERNRADSYIKNNQIAKLRFETMALSVETAESTVRDLRNLTQLFSSNDLVNLGPEDQSDIDDLQTRAFNAMQDMEYLLNQKVDGRYLFGGGKTTAPPVEIPFNNLTDFQIKYNGEDVTYPQTKAAHFSNFLFDDAAMNGVTIQQTAPDIGAITTGDANGFIIDSVDGSAVNTGDINFNIVNNEIRANVENAFANVQVGGTIVISGAAGGNNGVKIVKAVSPDGKTIELDPVTPVGVNETIGNGIGVNVGRTFPIGSTIELSNIDPVYDGDYTITGINGANQIEVRTNAFPAIADVNPSDGTQSIHSKSYYEGDNLSLTHRVSETRTIEFSVTAENSAFEKAIRAMGIICQDNMFDSADPQTDPNRAHDRIYKALELLDDAISHNSSVDEDKDDLINVYYQVDMNVSTMMQSIEKQTTFISFLDSRISEIEYMDPMLAASILNEEMQSLEVSYAVMAKTSQLNLLSFL